MGRPDRGGETGSSVKPPKGRVLRTLAPGSSSRRRNDLRQRNRPAPARPRFPSSSPDWVF